MDEYTLEELEAGLREACAVHVEARRLMDELDAEVEYQLEYPGEMAPEDVRGVRVAGKCYVVAINDCDKVLAAYEVTP